MTKICVSLGEPTTLGIVDRMADLADAADLFEIRGDLVTDLDLLAILRAKTRPLLFACRGASEGGRLDDADPRRREALREAVRRGFDYVDVEYRSGLLDLVFQKAGRGLLISYHDLSGTPDDLPRLYEAMAGRGADIVKIVITPRSMADVGRLLECATQAARGGGPPLIPIALGPLGVVTRIVAGRSGAPFTYASPAAGGETGAGQLPVTLLADLYRVRGVSAATGVYGVLGSDVARSLSPVLHNRAFAACGIDAVYVPLQAEDLQAFLAALPALGLSGFSVTRPYKEAILPHLNEVDEASALSGSVNTVLVRDGLLQGSSTDGTGVLTPLKKRRALKGQRAVVLGAGGAARAAALALTRRGAQVTVLARDARRAAAVARAVGCRSGRLTDLGSCEWDVLVNATPVGSAGAPDETPVPAQAHRAGSVVFDMVYDPVETRLLREARAAGCVVVDGREMLVAQAAAQFETWTGVEAPVGVMRSAVGLPAGAPS
jgi:3-dehydroquinate dehydratase/shikimate dehydrogenase